MTSQLMDRIAQQLSEDCGKNINGRASISHGYQILILREMQRRGINTKEIYNINH
jgi:hypothetical protein